MTRSGEPVPSWDENWRLLRQLWPSWEPTAETIRHVWFLAYDRPNSTIGAGFVDHRSLKEAIVEHARSSRWKEPEFLAISKLYRDFKNRHLTDRQIQANKTKLTADRLEIEQEHEKRMATIERWNDDRILAARNLIAKRFASFRGYTNDRSEWSPFYSGLITAADEEIQEELTTS
jgi:hypothetical protein